MALDWRWDRLVTQVDLLAWKLRAGLRKHRVDYEVAYRHVATTAFGDVTNVDLYDAAYQLSRHVDSAPVRASCTAVMEAVDRAVLYEWSTPAEGRLHGIGIYWPERPRAAAPRLELHRVVGLPLLLGGAHLHAYDDLGGLPDLLGRVSDGP